jgi:sphinganine-1-phosphate aldolase
MSGLYVMGQPQLCICAFTSDDFDIYALLTEMRGRGWTIGAMQFPPALHLDVTNLTTKKGVIELFIKVQFGFSIC